MDAAWFAVMLLLLASWAHTQGLNVLGPGPGLGQSGAAPVGMVAYNGVEAIGWTSAPTLSLPAGSCSNGQPGSCNNNATVTDTTFLTHHNFDGSVFSNAANLSPITRITDAVAEPGVANTTCTAGEGGSGDLILTSTNTSLVAIQCGAAEAVARFNPATGLVTQWITTNLCDSKYRKIKISCSA